MSNSGHWSLYQEGEFGDTEIEGSRNSITRNVKKILSIKRKHNNMWKQPIHVWQINKLPAGATEYEMGLHR